MLHCSCTRAALPPHCTRRQGDPRFPPPENYNTSLYYVMQPVRITGISENVSRRVAEEPVAACWCLPGAAVPHTVVPTPLVIPFGACTQTVILDRAIAWDVRESWAPALWAHDSNVTDVGVEGFSMHFPWTPYPGHHYVRACVRAWVVARGGW